jgi:REP element-mobilizing transposase RayT
MGTDSRRIGVRRSDMRPQTKREYLRHLVDGKTAAFPPLTAEEKALGFLGWHERGYLPHCDYPDLVQFVTIRLEDSMPASRSGEWEHLLALDNVREKRLRLEEYLDRGIGECHLRDPRIAAVTEQAFLHHHLAAYEILAWVIMPNHAHVLVHVWHTPLWKIILSWKRYVATRALRMLRAAPKRRAPIRRVPDTFWQREYWDTYMRDAEQETKSVRYIEANPTKSPSRARPRHLAFQQRAEAGSQDRRAGDLHRPWSAGL